MKRKLYLILSSNLLCLYALAQPAVKKTEVGNSLYAITWRPSDISQLSYKLKGAEKSYALTLPIFEIDGKKEPAVLRQLKQAAPSTVLKNGVTEYFLQGEFRDIPGLNLQVRLQVAPGNPVLRFQYHLHTDKNVRLTKTQGKDAITYLSFTTGQPQVKEIRLSQFNERFHATHLTEEVISNRYFENGSSFMGPILVASNGEGSFLAAYEHGSQYPDRFVEFVLDRSKRVAVQSVKGNYLHEDKADGFSSVWFQVAAVIGPEENLAESYRSYVLKYLSQNTESRKPYIFYNTWGRQERVQWAGQKYLTSMNLDWTLKEIERAYAMGIEVFVIDAGWFKKTGDWEVNKEFFPDELKQVKAKLDGYGMKLGLWFNPTVAALSSGMYHRNLQNRMSWNGKQGTPREIWETEESVGICLVSAYWEDFANKLISLTKELGVSYFKWDAIGQYGCNDPKHFHGTEKNTAEERTQRYAYLQPLYMSKIIDKVSEAEPRAIFDFDITEDGRCVGLQFLSSGKYFIINNGPYYHNFDLAEPWKSVLPNSNANIFVQPGPARGWFVRSVLDYDKWIPSVLFLTHYQPDEPRNSQIINIASLILGQSGIWGEILKTSNSGVQLFDTVLTKYKQVREDITLARMKASGEPGGSPEIYEKINPENGKGCVVGFANAKGTYTYITEHVVAPQSWKNEGVDIKRDARGRAVITITFQEPSAKIIFFGVQ
jgi:alpha-galactosidase